MANLYAWGAETTVGAALGTGQLHPRIAALPIGRYAVAWSYGAQQGSIGAEVFNPDGSIQVGEFSVVTTAQFDDFPAFQDITSLADGRFVIGWLAAEPQFD